MYDYNDKNTVEKHLFFLIQSILLFHDRCCFTFCFSSSYICTITMTKIQLENIYFSYSKYIIFYQYQNNLPAVHTYIYKMLKFSMPEKLLRTQWRSGRLSGLWFVIWRLKVHVQIFFRNIAGNSGGAKNSAEFLVLKWHNFLPYIRIYCTTSGLVTGN